MADLIDIKIDGSVVKIMALKHGKAIKLLIDAIDDIGNDIEERAKDHAPVNQDIESVLKAIAKGIQTPFKRSLGGTLKKQPVLRERAGTVTSFPLIGGGLTIRGAGGRFAKGPTDLAGMLTHGPGTLVASETLKVPPVGDPIVPYAMFVHEGTATKRAKPGSKQHYFYRGKEEKRRVVGPNPSQPYLEDALEESRLEYIPIRIAELRARLKLI